MRRAEALQLSRTLSLRLSYARLKVEHGWTLQSIDEVENLYSSHFRAQAQRRSHAARPPLSREFVDDEDGEGAPEIEAVIWRDAAAGLSSAMDWTTLESKAPEQLPSATALGKRKATSPHLDSSSHAPARSLPIRPSLTVPPSHHLKSFLSPSTTTSLPSVSLPSRAPVISVASSYDDFWAKLGSPSAQPASLPSRAATPNLRSPPSSSLSTLHRSPVRTKSPFYPVTIFPPKDKPPPVFDSLPKSNGRPLGAQASFSALPPIEPLPFALEQSGLRRGEDSSLDLGSHSSSEGVRSVLVRREVDEDFGGASQEEEISMQALDDAFGGDVRPKAEEGGTSN